VAELIWRLRAMSHPFPGARGGDLQWSVIVGGAAAGVLGWTLTVSLQAACAFALVVTVVACHRYDRRWGIFALFALWFLAPALRRLLALITGFVDNDPLSLAPFLATAAVAALELLRLHVPTRVRRILLISAAGFVVGLPVGLLTGPQSAVYACGAYLAGVAGAVLGLGEGMSVRDNSLRRVLLVGVPPIAAYAILQRVLPLSSWDQAWVDATNLTSLGTSEEGAVRVFASLNHPGALAPLLGLSLLCYLTIRRLRTVTLAGAALVAVALSLTFVRGAWVALIVAALAHVIVSDGRSARAVLGAAAVVVTVTLALAPVTPTAQEVVNRFKTIADPEDVSSAERSATVGQTLPAAVAAPLGHGLGSAGEPSKLNDVSNLRNPDNGYLALIYQAGPIGFLLVMAVVAYIFVAAWNGARARAPGQEMRQLLFSMLVFMLVLLYAGDEFYGSHGVIFWFICGQVLAFDYWRRRAATANRVAARAAP
jgi:putative inorganic carbon (hco3(-)) transporter